MVKQFTQAISVPSFPAVSRRILSHYVDLAGASTKFILPDFGRLHDDPEYRALDDSLSLSLPYEFIALEYTRINGELHDHVGSAQSSKAIVFARQRDDSIAITPAVWFDSKGMWSPMPEAAIPRTGYLRRDLPKMNGYTAVNVWRADERIPLSDYQDEIGTLLCFLNILGCSNVNVERVEPKTSGRKIKAALPFDTYHVLTIDVPRIAGAGESTGGHRSPREHLRRGHIRRMSDGRRIWVNATVVAAGRGAGVVHKDYAIRHGARA